MTNATKSRAEQIAEDLLEQIRRSQPGERFPAETEIASRLKVSRVTVREALSALERKGLITRRQGLGTFVNHNVVRIQTRLDESMEFLALIRAAGHEASVADARVRLAPAEAEAADRLGLRPGDQVVAAHKAFAADGVPVIQAVNIIPANLLRDASLHQTLAAKSLYAFLAEDCAQTVTYQIADVRAMPASPDVARSLGIAPGTPLLYIAEVGYRVDDLPLFFSEEHYISDLIQFKILRKPTA